MDSFEGFPVVIEKARGRHGRIRVTPEETIVLCVPRGMSVERVFDALKKQWPAIAKKLARIPKGLIETPKRFEDGERLTHFGRTLVLRRARIRKPIVDGETLLVPDSHTRKRLVDWMRGRVLEEAELSASVLSRRLGVVYERLEVRQYRSRLGCCVNGKVLKFHWGIGLLPREMFESVIAHEVAHLRHRGHDRAFWAAVGDLSPDYKAHHQVMRNLGSRLIF